MAATTVVTIAEMQSQIDDLEEEVSELRQELREDVDALYTYKNADEVFHLFDVETDFLWDEIEHAACAIRVLYAHLGIEQEHWVSYRIKSAETHEGHPQLHKRE